MDTKTALAMLSKGEKVYETHALGKTLSDKSAEYLEQYAATDNRILSQQQVDDIAMPFLQSLRKKVSTLVAAPDESLTVITRFDLHTGIRKMSERSQRDMGLKRLSAQLERVWHDDPMGGLTYGQVKHLIRSFKDDFPRSHAADAIEAECARVGLHKLPVAKLARIAAKVNSQADFELLVRDNKLDGDKIEQVRARTLIRSLVSMRSNKTAQEMVGDSLVAQSRPQGNLNFTLQMLEDAADLADQLLSDVDQASLDAFDGGLEDAGQQLQDLSSQLDQWMGGLTDARTSLTPAPDQQGPVAPPAPVPLSDEEEQDIQDAGMGKRKPPAPEKSLRGPEYDMEDAGMGKQKPAKPPLSPEEQDIEDAGLGKKKRTLDPRTWFAAKGADTIRLAKAASKAANLFDGEMGADLVRFAEVLNAITGQLAPMPGKPPMGPGMPELEMEMPLEENMPGEMGMEPPMNQGDGSVQAPELEMGVNVLQEIDEAANEIIEQAPPQAVDYIQHEMGEGHLAPPGTAEWGAEEVLNEGHEYAPPTEGWLQEEEQELGLGQGGLPMPDEMGGPPGDLGPSKPMAPMGASMNQTAKAPPGMEDTVMKLKKEYPGSPEAAFATAWSIYNNKKGGKEEGEESSKGKGGKGIPLPKGKIKQQQEVSTYAKKITPSGGGKVLKASDIEAKLLDGKTLKMGEVLIRINANDEVELWEKNAGRACSLMDLDIAIADFMAMTGMDRAAQAAPPAAPPAGGAPQPNGPTLTASDIQAALQHYKSMGMGPVDAISMLKKDYKERTELETPEMQTQILGISSSLWTSGAPAPAAGGAPGGAPLPEMPAPVPMAASVHDAQAKMKMPSIRKPKDHVSVPNDLGEDSEGKDLLPSPGGKIKTQPNKEQHQKLSPKELGKDSEGQDLLPDPGKPKMNHPPTDQAGIKLPEKKLDKDTEGNDPFETPSLGSSPSPRKQ